jgi:arginyl-tRNA synthetase
VTNWYSINGYDFNLEAMTSFEGDTGPYLQYAHARLCSIIRKSELKVEDLPAANLDLLTETHASDLARLLAQWPDVLLNTLRTLEPTTIISYLFRMTHVLSSSYDVLKVVGSEPELKLARMALYEAARQVLNNGMRVLGLSPVQRYALLNFKVVTVDGMLTSATVCKERHQKLDTLRRSR